jgi:phage baseplate assembly protein W
MVTVEEATANPQEYLGRDIAIDDTGDSRISTSDDYQLIRFYDNLKQAIRLRLSTSYGELALHPDYGCRLNELLGQVPTPDLLLLAQAYVKDALLQEPRVDSIIKLRAKYRDNVKNVIDIELQVQPIKVNEPLNMVYSVFI